MSRLPTSDLRIRAARPLLFPATLAAELPLDDTGADFVAQSRRVVEDIILGRDDRLLAVVGPCSVHDPAAAREYAERLR
jgi:3-deoxy-7-phosphoheptulonate synthase